MYRNLVLGFLLCYVLLLGQQLLALGMVPWYMWAAFFAGLVASVFAHKRAGVLALVALAAHLFAECYYHAKHGFVYDGSAPLFYAVHVVFDFVFLVYQSREVSKRYAPIIVVGILLALIGVGYVTYQPAMQSFAPYLHPYGHAHAPSVWKFLVLGSITGCALMHVRSVKSRNKSIEAP